jgi:hypothetical protein
MMKRIYLLAAFLLVVGLVTLAAFGGDDETEIPLEKVPDVVRQAVLEAVPGIELLEAEVEEENGHLVYELEGVLDGKTYEIEVTEDGEVLKVEQDDGDEDDDEDGDEDDDGRAPS